MKTPIEVLKDIVASVEALQDPKEPDWFGEFENPYEGYIEWPNLRILIEEAKEVLKANG